MNIQTLRAGITKASFDHACPHIELMETHISWLVLSGEFVYKIKKPVDFGFLDFSTIEKRLHFCKQELTLNQRFAPELYLTLCAVIKTQSGFKFTPIDEISDAGDIQDYAVKMREFRQQDLFLNRLDQDKVNEQGITQLAQLIATFHQSAEIMGADSAFGTPQLIQQAIEQNFQQIRKQLPAIRDHIEEQKYSQIGLSLDFVENWSQDQLMRHAERLSQRRNTGFIRDCHGDMHSGNITWYQQQPCLFDCIEFNDRLRCIDVISDLAFLTMDLQFQGYPSFANQLLNQYLEISGDYQGVALLPLYQSYRAMVRAKVAILSITGANADQERKIGVDNFLAYLDFAEQQCRIPLRFLLYTHGLSGSGKTTIARQVAKKLNAVCLRSDVERKRLFGRIRSTENSIGTTGLDMNNGLDPNTGLYSEEMTRTTYHHLIELALCILQSGYPVIIDAANLKVWQRQLIEQLAQKEAVPSLILNCSATEDELQDRLTTRQKLGKDASDADISVMHQQRQRQEPLSKQELDHSIDLDTREPEIEKLATLLGFDTDS